MNIFTPFIFTLTFFNNGARWLGETFLPLYFLPQDNVFIPPLRESVSYQRPAWRLADMMTYPDFGPMDRQLVHTALEFAESVPDFKICFPEIWEGIVDFCSHTSTFITEYQYTVMALRFVNCLHHRSLGIDEIDFEFIDEEYMTYLGMMTEKERSFYHKMYNVARGLCLRERQERTNQNIHETAKHFQDIVDRYLHYVQRNKNRLALSVKLTMQKADRKREIANSLVNKTGIFLKELKRKSLERCRKRSKFIKNVLDESDSFTRKVEKDLNAITKNFKKITRSLEDQKNLERSWLNFAQEYSRKTAKMELKMMSIEKKLGKIYEAKLKGRHELV